MSSSIDYTPSPSPGFCDTAPALRGGASSDTAPALRGGALHVVDRALLRATVEARIGRTVGQRYTLTQLLGVGGMAAVYEAVCRDGERVAIKMLHPAHGRRLERRKRFLREAYLANAIGHPGMVRIHADGVDHDGSVFLIMELLEGATVRALQCRAGGQLDLELGLRIADQVLEVLAVAHAVGVTHRDIKPENLFVTYEGQVKVLDFGIAHMRDEVPGMTLRTQPGAVLGTPSFMAPEQLLGCIEVDRRSDLFSLGATLFSLLSGDTVRAARRFAPELNRNTIFAARSLRSAWPGAPDTLVQVIDRALSFEPDSRWPDARSMQQALRAVPRRASYALAAKREARAMQTAATAATLTTPNALEGRLTWLARLPRHPRALPLALAALAVAVAAMLALRAARSPLPAAGSRLPVARPAPAVVAPAAVAPAAVVPAAVAPAAVPSASRQAVTSSHAPARARAARSERRPAARRYDVVANDIVDPWE